MQQAYVSQGPRPRDCHSSRTDALYRRTVPHPSAPKHRITVIIITKLSPNIREVNRTISINVLSLEDEDFCIEYCSPERQRTHLLTYSYCALKLTDCYWTNCPYSSLLRVHRPEHSLLDFLLGTRSLPSRGVNFSSIFWRNMSWNAAADILFSIRLILVHIDRMHLWEYDSVTHCSCTDCHTKCSETNWRVRHHCRVSGKFQ